MLPANQVDIWKIHLDGQKDVSRESRLLSTDEALRAERFLFEKHKIRFIRTRAFVRQILGGYVSVEPAQLTFSYGANGKPEFSREMQCHGINFNLSHSEGLALLAITRGLALGVDIEQVNPNFSGQEIAERYFSANEVKLLGGLPEAVRTQAFFSCWTRKEAYIKALGMGLSVPLDSFEVGFSPGGPKHILGPQDDSGEVSRWSIYDIEAAEGYKAALVVEGEGHRLHHREASHDEIDRVWAGM